MASRSQLAAIMLRMSQLVALACALLFWTLASPAAALPLPQRVVDGGFTNDPFVRAGFLPVTLYDGWNGHHVDPTGVADSTAAIQKAIEDGRESALVTFLPPGTYLVSDTLIGMQNYQVWGCADHFGKPAPGQPYADYGTGFTMRKAPSLVGPTSGPRPVLKLKDASPGFGDANNPKAVLHFYGNGPGYGYEKPWMGQFDCGMNFHVRNLEIQLGSGNSGAIGLQIPSAQYSAVQDVKIVATGAYAGLRGSTHTRSVVNLEVEGGRYGVIFALGSENLVGATLRNQEAAAVLVSCYSPVSLTGFKIEKQSGPAIVIDTSQFNMTNQGSQLTLLDGVIDIANASGPAIENDVDGTGSSLYARNVFVRTSGDLVRSGSTSLPSSGATFSRIVEYVHTDTRENAGVGAATLIDGVLGAANIANVVPAAQAPSDLVSRHARAPLPWFADAGVKNVLDADVGAKGDGRTDDTAALQRAIDQHRIVFLPRGDYRISSTLTLHKDTVLVGVPSGKSRIMGEGWPVPSSFAPMMRTDDDANATTFVSDVWLFLPGGYDHTYLSALQWRAGRHSIVNELYYEIPWEQERSARARSAIHVAGNGGGRWYSPMFSQMYDGRTDNPGHRALLVEGTTQPLTIYSMNAEYSNSTASEIRNASNVRIIGNKTEVTGTYLLLDGARNVFHAGMAGHCQIGFGQPCGPTFTSIAVKGSSDVVLANETFYPVSHDLGALLSEVPANVTVSGKDNISVFKRGDFDDAVFPHCGDAICDPQTESSASCPIDCADAAANPACPTCDGGAGAAAVPATPDAACCGEHGAAATARNDGESSGCSAAPTPPRQGGDAIGSSLLGVALALTRRHGRRHGSSRRR